MSSWAFDGITFDVAADGAIFDEWFAEKTERTIDPVLGGTTRYVDIGGVTYDPLTLVAQLTSKTTRDSLIAKRGGTGTLTDDDGRSVSALLAEATPVRVKTPTSGYYRATLVFERLS